MARPTPMLMTILVSLGIAIGLSWLNLAAIALAMSFLYWSSRRAIPVILQHVCGVHSRFRFVSATNIATDQGFFAAARAGVGRLAWADVSQADAARLAVALLLAVVGEPVADADAAVALGAITAARWRRRSASPWRAGPPGGFSGWAAGACRRG